ncbi:hypothetical protein [Fontivita pretiosa]|uniref:hypothetical protein n=1 Tax=Fontivita pretiosa TaxID=2989684 RepID=UPI003D17D8C9
MSQHLRSRVGQRGSSLSGVRLWMCGPWLCLAIISRVAGQPVVIPPGPGNGLVFEQLSFQFGGASESFSRWGEVTADPQVLQSATGIASGYLNVVTSDGAGGTQWLVQNLYLNAADGYGPISRTFDLLQSGAHAAISARVEYSPAPLQTISPGGQQSFSLAQGLYNAEGAGDAATSSIGLPNPPNAVGFIPGGVTTVNTSQPNLSNVQAATNQCFPMSIANSLQYLENRFGLNVPNNHVPGIKGDNSLVGKLDTAANRNAPNRNSGSGVWFVPMLQGKFRYLSDSGLAGNLIHRHRGMGYGGAGNQLPAGNFTSSGITSTSDGMPITWQWICDELARGEDVEIVWTYDDAMGNPTGGHAVRVFECGTTLGIPWIGYAHDRLQSNLDPMDNMGLETVREFLFDSDADGLLNIGSANREVRFAFSESIPEPATLALHLLPAGLLCGRRRQRTPAVTITDSGSETRGCDGSRSAAPAGRPSADAAR